jgi:hypothetical protein
MGHRPAVQVEPAGHGFSHPPQFALSVFVSTHPDLHIVRLLAQAHAPHVQLAMHVWLAPLTAGEQSCVLVGEHTPSPVHAVGGPVQVPLVLSHVGERVPQLPHISIGCGGAQSVEHFPAEHVPPAGHAFSHLSQLLASLCVSTHPALHMLSLPGHAHAPHAHLSVQVSLAPGTAGEHAVVVCGAHTPGVGHAVYGPVHVPAVMSHVRECVTQLPQLSDGAVPVHGMLCPVHVPHSQLELQVCVPLELTPHFCVASGVQPPLFSPMHADQSDTLPVLPSQVRDCVPHMPQALVNGSVHVCPMHVAH